MQDGKGRNVPFLGQNFKKAFDVKFANAEGKQYVWGPLGGFQQD
jgi:prolyl-tRNA synthetase